MNRSSIQKRAQILGMMVEGLSIHSITRLTGASKNTVKKLLVDPGHACAAYHDDHVRNLKSQRIQCDEIWSFCALKVKNVPPALVAEYYEPSKKRGTYKKINSN